MAQHFQYTLRHVAQPAKSIKLCSFSHKVLRQPPYLLIGTPQLFTIDRGFNSRGVPIFTSSYIYIFIQAKHMVYIMMLHY